MPGLCLLKAPVDPCGVEKTDRVGRGFGTLGNRGLKDLETQREVAACLCHLALADDNRSDIILSGAAQPLLEMAQSPDVEEVARFANGAVANVAEDPMTHRAIGHHLNGMHILIYLMGSRHVSVHREAARAVSNLLTEARPTVLAWRKMG